jgi:hypothetical protein
MNDDIEKEMDEFFATIPVKTRKLSESTSTLCYRALLEACKYVEGLQSCPADQGLIDSNAYDCEHKCKQDIGAECWKYYFEKIAS